MCLEVSFHLLWVFSRSQHVALLLVDELPHLELFQPFAYILLLYTVIKAAFQEETEALIQT